MDNHIEYKKIYLDKLRDPSLPQVHTISLPQTIDPLSGKSFEALVLEKDRLALPYILAVALIKASHPLVYLDGLTTHAWQDGSNKDPLVQNVMTHHKITSIFFFSIWGIKDEFTYLGSKAHVDLESTVVHAEEQKHLQAYLLAAMPTVGQNAENKKLIAMRQLSIGGCYHRGHLHLQENPTNSLQGSMNLYAYPYIASSLSRSTRTTLESCFQ